MSSLILPSASVTIAALLICLWSFIHLCALLFQIARAPSLETSHDFHHQTACPLRSAGRVSPLLHVTSWRIPLPAGLWLGWGLQYGLCQRSQKVMWFTENKGENIEQKYFENIIIKWSLIGLFHNFFFTNFKINLHRKENHFIKSCAHEL